MIAFVILPTFMFLWFSDLQPRFGSSYLSLQYFLLALAFIVGVGAAALIASNVGRATQTRPVGAVPLRFLDFLAITTLLAYVLWFWRLAIDPGLLRGVLLGLSMHLRSEVTTIPGLTTLTQLGIVYSTLYSIVRWVYRRNMGARYSIYLGLIIFLSMVRTVAWGERLATIEVIVPLLVVYLAFRPFRGRIARFLLILGPYFGLALLLTFFAVTEQFRSWGKQQVGADSMSAFMAERFAYYYYSSLNNGCGLLQEYAWPQGDMVFTFKWVYTFPLVGAVLTEHVDPSSAPHLFLQHHGDTEFTTYSGIFPVFYDWGLPIGLAIAVLLGIWMGTSYRQFRAGRGLGLLVYPLLYLHLLEILRIFYLGYSRVVPALLFLVIAYGIGYGRYEALEQPDR